MQTSASFSAAAVCWEGGRENGKEGEREGRRMGEREGERKGGREKEREGGNEEWRKEGMEERRKEGMEKERKGERSPPVHAQQMISTTHDQVERRIQRMNH